MEIYCISDTKTTTTLIVVCVFRDSHVEDNKISLSHEKKIYYVSIGNLNVTHIGILTKYVKQRKYLKLDMLKIPTRVHF